MRVALNLEHEGRLYVAADVWPMAARHNRDPRAVLSSVAYAWRTRAGAWSQTHRVLGHREDVPAPVRWAALDAARLAYLEQAKRNQESAEVLRLAMLSSDAVE
jgi:hypothetical protein